MKKFVFELRDKLTPNQYISQEIIPMIAEATDNYLFGKLDQYSGRIHSYETRTKGGLSSVLGNSLVEEKVVRHDIQTQLGELNREETTYEFYIGSTVLKSYKYRILFLR